MRLGVLIAGVLDPKRPLECPASGQWLDLLSQATTPFKLSPFDESALEVALKLRDRNPGTTLTVIVTDGATDTQFLRTVAAYRPDQLLALPPDAANRGDPHWLAQQFGLIHEHLQGSDVELWLMGRELGDLDDGVIPPYLAHAWGLTFIGLALSVHTTAEGRIQCVRTLQEHQEQLTFTMPALISISNDKSNKLRHPLMKNVMLAKQQKFAPLLATPLAQRAPYTALRPLESASREGVRCQMLTGTIVEQATAFAQYLTDLRERNGAPGPEPAKDGRASSALTAVESETESESESESERIATLRHQDSTIYLFSAEYPNEERAARLAQALGATPLGRCEKIELTEKGFRITRSGFGARARLERMIGDGHFIAVVRDLAQLCSLLATRHTETLLSTLLAERLVPPPLTGAAQPIEIDILPQHEQQAALEGASIVVSGGRGIGSAEGFEWLYALARALDGAVSASLPAVDAGWAPVARQVGQSGKYIRPKLYIGIGVSGTPQHMAGIDPLSHIAAINIDPEAPIFKQAQIGIVGDWADILPEVLRALPPQVTATGYNSSLKK